MLKTDVKELAEYERRFGSFDLPMGDVSRNLLKSMGLSGGAYNSESCMVWLWTQWLQGRSTSQLSDRVSTHLRQSVEMRDQTSVFDFKPLHDLLMLVCACLGGSESDLHEVATISMDSSGDASNTPSAPYELHECAWAGMFKYWILGDLERSKQEADIIWKTRAFPSLKGASATLVTPWLERDWSAFRKRQKSDFSRLWTWAKRNKIAVEKKTKRNVDFPRLVLVKERWCWAHCAMAMLARRHGVDVETDVFWFPPAALEL